MQDYKRKNFFVEYNDEGVKKYFFITDHNERIEVTYAVYKVLFYDYLKQRRDNMRDKDNNLISYDNESSSGHTLLNSIGYEIDYNKITLISQMMDIVEELNENEKEIIKMLFFEGTSLKQASIKLETPVMTLQNRKNRILAKLRNKLKL